MRLSHRGNSSILAIVDTQISSKLQQQLRAHRSISMDASHKPDLGLGRLWHLRGVCDLQGPDVPDLHTLTKTRQNKTRSLL